MTVGHISMSREDGFTILGPYHGTVLVYHSTNLPKACQVKVFFRGRFGRTSSARCCLNRSRWPFKDGSAVFSTGPSILSRMLQSSSSSPIGSFPGSLDTLSRAWFQGSITRGRIRDFSGSSSCSGLMEALSWPFSPPDARTPIQETCETWSTSLPARYPVPSVPGPLVDNPI